MPDVNIVPEPNQKALTRQTIGTRRWPSATRTSTCSGSGRDDATGAERPRRCRRSGSTRRWCPTTSGAASPFHVEGPAPATPCRLLLDGLAEAGDSPDASPIGLVVQGQRGSGKTHLLGWVREQIQRAGGYFFLVGLPDARELLGQRRVSMLDGLSREAQDDGDSQLTSSWIGSRRWSGCPGGRGAR